MRKRILALVVLLAVGVYAATALAATPAEKPAVQQTKPQKHDHCPTPFTAGEFRPFAKKVWNPDKWERGKPKKAVLKHARHMRGCAAGPGHRKAMRSAWRSAKRKFTGERHYQLSISPPGLSTLVAIASCESGGDPTAVDASGTYRGKYQFDYRTWESVGGHGDPAAAPEREQDERAAELYNRSGSSPWPVCG